MPEAKPDNPFARLQEIDLALGRLAHERSARSAAITRAEAALKSATTALAAIEEQIRSATLRQRQIDVQLKALDQEAAKFEAAASSASKSGAYKVATEAAAKSAAKMDELETLGLELLEQVEQLNTKRDAEAKRLDTETTRLAEARSGLTEWEALGGAEEDQLRSEEAEALKGLATGIADAIRDAAATGRPVFARVKDGSCSSCGSEMPSSYMNRPAGDPAGPCMSCGKILIPGE